MPDKFTAQPDPAGDRAVPPSHPPAPPGAAAPAPAPNEDVWVQLILRGKDRGFITVQEIARALRSAGVDATGDLARVYACFADMGIPVRERVLTSPDGGGRST